MDRRNYYLDTFRILAALMVFWVHLAGFILAPIRPNPNLVEKALNASTGYGHQAVMVFFVLSGYLISRGIWENRFRWKPLEYMSKRLARLWIVLIPCLLLTLMWNFLGMRDDPNGYYLGHLNHIYRGSRTFPVDLSFSTFIGNLLFLQTIFTKMYGDNEVLWSLANEFWYYVLFPCLVFIFHGKNITNRLFCGLGAVLIIILMPASIRAGFFVWLIGFGVHLLRNSSLNRFFKSKVFFWSSLVAFLGTLQATHSFPMPEDYTDIIIGLMFGAVTLASLNRGNYPSLFKKPVSFASDMSYTLYLAHFPVMTFYVTKFLRNTQLPRGLDSLPHIGLVSIAIVTYCILLYLLFERNTDNVRKWVMASLKRRPQKING